MGGVRPSRAASLFLDSSAWIAVNNPGDGRHSAARDFYREIALLKYRDLVTTNLVVAETHAGLLRARDKRGALRFLALLDISARVQIVYATAELERAARGLLVRYQDQPFSLCDAVSLVVMQEQDIQDAFAFGRHFETAGFRRLPRL